MLPWMVIYDHQNYGKWGAVYLADMYNLEKNAPMKSYHKATLLSNNRLNQVPGHVDQGTEWVNR